MEMTANLCVPSSSFMATEFFCCMLTAAAAWPINMTPYGGEVHLIVRFVVILILRPLGSPQLEQRMLYFTLMPPLVELIYYALVYSASTRTGILANSNLWCLVTVAMTIVSTKIKQLSNTSVGILPNEADENFCMDTYKNIVYITFCIFRLSHLLSITRTRKSSNYRPLGTNVFLPLKCQLRKAYWWWGAHDDWKSPPWVNWDSCDSTKISGWTKLVAQRTSASTAVATSKTLLPFR